MRTYAVAAAIAVAFAGVPEAGAQSPANPHAFTCGAYLAAQQGQDRGQANAMLYWAVGYLQGRLSAQPTTNFTADTFGKDISDVHGVLTQICPNVPDMTIATFMSNVAGDFERSARPQ